jgi:hypothetical protein
VFVNGYGPTKSLAGSLDETRRADLRRDFVAFHDQFKTELGIAVPRTYPAALAFDSAGLRKQALV